MNLSREEMKDLLGRNNMKVVAKATGNNKILYEQVKLPYSNYSWFEERSAHFQLRFESQE